MLSSRLLLFSLKKRSTRSAQPPHTDLRSSLFQGVFLTLLLMFFFFFLRRRALNLIVRDRILAVCPCGAGDWREERCLELHNHLYHTCLRVRAYPCIARVEIHRYNPDIGRHVSIVNRRSKVRGKHLKKKIDGARRLSREINN